VLCKSKERKAKMEGKPSMKEEDFSVSNDTGRAQEPEGGDAVGVQDLKGFSLPSAKMIDEHPTLVQMLSCALRSKMWARVACARTLVCVILRGKGGRREAFG
jgi:hypothetical protein